MTDIDSMPPDVLDDISYLSRSTNRVAVLDALIEEPRSTRTLQETTETPKPTLNRILNEFDERAWAVRNIDGRYEVTPHGEHIAVQFRSFAESMGTIRDLGEDIAVIPATELTLGPNDDITVDLDVFSDATVKHQRAESQGVGRDELIEAARESASMHVLSDIAPPRILGNVLEDRVVGGELSGAFVFAAELTEYLLENPNQPPNWPEVIEGGVEILRYDGSVPSQIAVFDEATLIWGASEEMRHRVIISNNGSVRRWALAVIERYRGRADRLAPDEFA